jgi:glycosyltransferase involved in cell wall biosynthesis
VKVAQVTLRYDAPGGVETTVREVSTRLLARGVAVTVYASDLYDEAAWERRPTWRPRVDGVPVERFPVYRRLLPGVTMPMMTGLVARLADDRPDVLHAHSHRYGHVLETAAVAQATGRPLVVSTHYHPADQREPRTKRGLLRLQDHLFGGTAYRWAQAIVVETALEARRVAEFAPAARVRVIPPGIDLAAWKAGAATDPVPADLPEGYILYAGRVAANKGLEGLVEAMAQLPASRRPPLVILGRDWGERGRVEARARALGVAEQVHFLGHVTDMAAYRGVFRGARLFVLPSEYEAFGLVLLEAMAAGCPIVATAVGGVPEVLDGGRCGRLVPYGDPAALARAIEERTTDAAAAGRAVDAARQRVEGLTWEVAADRHLALYRALTGAG